VLDVSQTPSAITAHAPGYIDGGTGLLVQKGLIGLAINAVVLTVASR
jgi:hypothetical protein